MQQPESDESQFVKDINEQKLLLTKIKQSGNKDVSKIKQLIQSIISASSNYEYIWYFENNLVANCFIVDAFQYLINSYFVLETKDTITALKIISTMLLCTQIEQKTNGSLAYEFKHDWIIDYYSKFFINILQVFQYSLKQFELKQDMELAESVLVLIQYIVVSVPLNHLIKMGFIEQVTGVLPKLTNKLSPRILKICDVLISKINSRVKYAATLKQISKKIQFEFLTQIKKVMLAVLEHKKTISLEELILPDLRETFIDFYQNLFKTINHYCEIVDFFSQLNRDQTVFVLPNDLAQHIGTFLQESQISKCLHLKEDSDIMFNFVLFIKTTFKHDLSYVIKEKKFDSLRNLTIVILKHLLNVIKATSKITQPYCLESNFYAEPKLIIDKLESMRVILPNLVINKQDKDEQSYNHIFRHLINNNLFGLFEDILWVLRNATFGDYITLFRNDLLFIVNNAYKIIEDCNCLCGDNCPKR